MNKKNTIVIKVIAPFVPTYEDIERMAAGLLPTKRVTRQDLLKLYPKVRE